MLYTLYTLYMLHVLHSPRITEVARNATIQCGVSQEKVTAPHGNTVSKFANTTNTRNTALLIQDKTAYKPNTELVKRKVNHFYAVKTQLKQ